LFDFARFGADRAVHKNEIRERGFFGSCSSARHVRNPRINVSVGRHLRQAARGMRYRPPRWSAAARIAQDLAKGGRPWISLQVARNPLDWQALNEPGRP